MPWPIELGYVLPCYFDQQDTRSLNLLLAHYAGYAGHVLDRIQFLVVDDGSPVPVKLAPDLDLNIRLLRIDNDVPWNQGGARNLGVLFSQADKVLLTDVDHSVPEEVLARLLARSNPGCNAFRFPRRDIQGEPIAAHPNTLFMSRMRFLGNFGYDEEFSGHYGYEDGMFSRWLRYNGIRQRTLPARFAIRKRVVNLENSYHTLVRDKSVNRELKRRKIAEWYEWGPRGGHSRRFLEQPFTTVEQRYRSALGWRPKPNRWWKPTWALRQLWPCR